MTDELDGDVITEFISGGAKNYGYQTRGGKVVCKVRGSAILNFRTMKENILSELDSPQDSRQNLNIVTPYYFKRDLEKKHSSGSAREAVWVGVRQAHDRCGHSIELSLWLREDWG